MRKAACLLFLLFLINPFTILAATPTPAPAAAIPVDGLAVPGLTCGIGNDSDPKKAKCCVPVKQDDAPMQAMNFTAGLPILGPFFAPLSNKYTEINRLSQQVEPCESGSVPSKPNDLSNKNCVCIKNVTLGAVSELNVFCTKYFPAGGELQNCSRCMTQTGGFYTALGCIPLDLSLFITKYVLGTGIGIAGGVALLCILYSAFRMQTSMGNAEALKKAQENLTACITGLIIVIFSVLILKIIGVDILRIPGIG